MNSEGAGIAASGRPAVEQGAIYRGHAPCKPRTGTVDGEFVSIEGERFYRISNYDLMPPFFMSIVSHSDHWMFISSNGALTAGRKNPENALFPYVSVDKIHDSHGITGGKTLFLVEKEQCIYLWEPLSYACDGLYDIERNLYKNIPANKLLFEEKNHDLGLTFQTTWTTTERFGFARRSTLVSHGNSARARVLDGIQNLLPYGTDRMLQSERSNLLDAYKKSELLPDCGLGLFLLSSIPVDRPEPSEALSATTVWSTGLENARYLLSSQQTDRFRRGESIESEIDIRAQRGAYFISAELDLASRELHEWFVVAEVEQGPAEVALLREQLGNKEALREMLVEDVAIGTTQLRQIVAEADGLQASADEMSAGRHFSNVLFNVMRGGAFADGYQVSTADLIDFVAAHNREVRRAHQAFFESLPASVDVTALLTKARATGEPDLTRLCHEYLPLYFSRRHGDPSRPWNHFSINVKGPNGGQALNYEGNWRDIFQNWEALLASYPEFTTSVISKFVNASTLDGYNPYRITRNGIDWETEDPADPWSFIGYWGDHQIIYLLKLLEISRRFQPGELERMLLAKEFAYANVPYRLKPFENLVQDPHRTIDFDDELEAVIEARVKEVGADGRLVWNGDGEVRRASLLEKLLVSVLTKFSNFIPEAGIWLNTQRPEWNDANNALVGYGVSMVTLCYLRRFLSFLQDLLENVDWDAVQISEAVARFLADLTEPLQSHSNLLDTGLSDQDRWRVLKAVGTAGSRYRESVYQPDLDSTTSSVSRADILAFVNIALAWTDQSIRANRRSDGLYHAYNLMEVKDDQVSVSYLYEMLEGQVAVLSSGLLSPGEAVEVLTALKNSALFRSDQYSYLLYPDRDLPRFLEKNRIPDEAIAGSLLLSRLVEAGDRRLVVMDVDGLTHFNGTFRNRHDVDDALTLLAKEGFTQVDAEREQILDLFESVFDHRSYTGRSGTFFGYEGLGCIYWHMVSKLLLATAETYARAVREAADEKTLAALVEHYYEIRAGIGLNKGPEVFGAFPTDPYSHTPANAGAKQPGMTGQVKEDILARWEELGVAVEDGCLSFSPSLLRSSEFLNAAGEFEYFDVGGNHRRIGLKAGELAFTYCQVPITYRSSGANRLRVSVREGDDIEVPELALDRRLSSALFGRTGEITSICVEFAPTS